MTFPALSLSPEMTLIVILVTIYGAHLGRRAWEAWSLYSSINFIIPDQIKTRLLYYLAILTVVVIPQTIAAPAAIQPLANSGFGTPEMGLKLTQYVVFVWIPVGMFGLIIGPIILKSLGQAEAAVLAATPYDFVADASDNSSEKIFNLFLSYKSEDVAIVRRHADRLLANGFTVWFAEYMILLQNYDEFENAINRGLRQSDFGFIFTNDRYFNSEWCLHELKGLLHPEHCGPSKICDVRLADTSNRPKNIPGLAEVFGKQFRGKVEELLVIPDDVTRQVQEHWGEQSSIPNEGKPFYDERLGYHINLTGWDLYYRGTPHLTEAGFIGPAFRRKLEGKWLGLHISIGVAAASRGNPIEAEFSEISVNRAIKAAHTNISEPLAIPNDREHYRQALAFAKKWEKDSHVKCVGLHLFFYAGHSHLALTYSTHRGWNRRYSIVLVDPLSGLSIEIAIVFKFMGLFSEYCKYTAYMDNLVQSLH